DRYIGYWKPYATSHQELDENQAVLEEVRNAARSLAEGVRKRRAGQFRQLGANLKDPRPK
ncbi:MAG: NADPH-dependent FMN reductase, partial [Rhizobiaceae bacterium]